MKKLINPIQGVIVITGFIAVMLFIFRYGSLEFDRITVEQFYTSQALTLLYIVFVWAVYRVLGNIKIKL